jgi:hypothetical protein
MISAGNIRLRLLRPYCFRTSYYFCWALPLLRLCLTTTTTNNNPNLSNAVILCDAFSPATTGTSRNLAQQRQIHFAPYRSETPTPTPTPWLLQLTPNNKNDNDNAPIRMARRGSSTLRGSRITSAAASSKGEDGLPETTTMAEDYFASSPARKSPRKRSRESESEREPKKKSHRPSTKDWASLKVVELQEELRSRGLKATGRKADLVSLLEQQDDGGEIEMPGGDADAKTDADAAATKSPKTKIKAKAPASSPSPSKTKTASSPKKKQNPPKKKAADHQRITDIDELPKLWNEDMAKANGSYSKYCSIVVLFQITKVLVCFFFRFFFQTIIHFGQLFPCFIGLFFQLSHTTILCISVTTHFDQMTLCFAR